MGYTPLPRVMPPMSEMERYRRSITPPRSFLDSLAFQLFPVLLLAAAVIAPLLYLALT